MADALDMGRLLASSQPGLWSLEECWAVFRHLLDKEGPLPGVGVALEPFAPLFARVHAKVAGEHAHCTARYYRDEAGRPLVNPLNIEHLTRLLHPFSRALFDEGAPTALLDCLFYVMKSRCALNLFYRTQEIDYFLPLHALGSVIGYGEFGPFLAITQNCTIGHNHGHYPTIAGGLWMGPGSAILGRSSVGRNVRIAANALVVDRDVPDDVIVFGVGTDIKFKDNPIDNRLLALDGGFPA